MQRTLKIEYGRSCKTYGAVELWNGYARTTCPSDFPTNCGEVRRIVSEEMLLRALKQRYERQLFVPDREIGTLWRRCCS